MLVYLSYVPDWGICTWPSPLSALAICFMGMGDKLLSRSEDIFHFEDVNRSVALKKSKKAYKKLYLTMWIVEEAEKLVAKGGLSNVVDELLYRYINSAMALEDNKNKSEVTGPKKKRTTSSR